MLFMCSIPLSLKKSLVFHEIKDYLLKVLDKIEDRELVEQMKRIFPKMWYRPSNLYCYGIVPHSVKKMQDSM